MEDPESWIAEQEDFLKGLWDRCLKCSQSRQNTFSNKKINLFYIKLIYQGGFDGIIIMDSF